MDRISYKELKQWFFEDAYLWCQRKFKNGKINKWIENETEWGGALYSFENSFDMPIENLMLYTIGIITDSGRDKIYHSNLMKVIDDILKNNDIEILISCLEEEEKRDFLYDLNLVLNNREIEE
ncbi:MULTISPECIES: hypothetical protein [Actinobacillus]|uniref:hypothetical protein n=1 Tax=Actinobacillus TaxID=713 RepID=UPI002442046E|nr:MULTISPECIES: hypothetical protein [Actinobacillus]WGE34825.1 hypothetical protein NYR61_04570 [Actinobacillus genomosp. 1]WGE82658.1 hypothetical protein NYR86_06355 [Actinobacillus equuli subsp. equuli]